jgi:(2Fe-2S) ferredoxin
MRYPFEKHIVICTGPRCDNPERGEERGQVIRDLIKGLNKTKGRKQMVRVCSVSCLDLCDYGPNMVVWPEGTVFSHLDRESAVRVYEGIMGDGPAAEDKELKPS